MAVSDKGDILSIPVYSEESEKNKIELTWQQQLRVRTAHYYVVKAQNQSKGNADVLMYISDRFYTDIGRFSDARQEGITVNNDFQYGEKNKSGECRWIVLHDKSNNIYQHRFMLTAMQSKLDEATRKLTMSFGAGDITDQFMRSGNRSLGEYLRTF
ncbi:hypothetical protein FGRMN_10762 [Fusarium graminum]|nr:hypothetical protein FGRMN_10762 [Fusarium graminum]